jgi:hypothetical protein
VLSTRNQYFTQVMDTQKSMPSRSPVTLPAAKRPPEACPAAASPATRSLDAVSILAVKGEIQTVTFAKSMSESYIEHLCASYLIGDSNEIQHHRINCPQRYRFSTYFHTKTKKKTRLVSTEMQNRAQKSLRNPHI